MQGPGDFHHQTAHADHTAIDFDAVEFVNLLGQRLHRGTAFMPQPAVPPFRVLTVYLPAALIIAWSLGTEGSPGRAGGASPQSRLAPKLNLIHEHPRGSKTTLLQYLKAIRWNLPRRCLHLGIRFC